MVNKVCPNCSALTDTDKSFCLECGAQYSSRSSDPSSSSSSPEQSNSNDRVTIISLIGVLAGIFHFFLPIGTSYGSGYGSASFGDRLRLIIGFPDLGSWAEAGEKAHYFFSVIPFWAALIVLIISLANRSK